MSKNIALWRKLLSAAMVGGALWTAGSAAASEADPFRLEGDALRKELKLSRPVAKLDSAEGVGIRAAAEGKSAVYQQKLDWDAAKIKQFIVTAKTEKPGRFRLAADLMDDGQKRAVRLFLTADPDGAFHEYSFPVGDQAAWKGRVTNYELRWFGEEGDVVIKSIRCDATARRRSEGRELFGKVRLFKAEAVPSDDAVLARVGAQPGGFYQTGLAWPTGEIKAVRFSLMSKVAGRVRFACSCKLDGKQLNIALPPQSVPGDGQYHDYVFVVAGQANWKGVMTNYELRWLGGPAEIGLNAVGAEDAVPAGMAAAASAPAAAGTVTASPVRFPLRGEALRKAVQVKNMTLLPDGGDALTAEVGKGADTPFFHVRGAFYQGNLALKSDEVRQLEFELMAETPGYFTFHGSQLRDGKRVNFQTSPQAIIPDGEYHHYIFHVAADPKWGGVLTNYELRWTGDPGKVSLRSIDVKNCENRIANADHLVPGREAAVEKLMPRAKCRLQWHGESSPGVTLRFYNRDLEEIPGSAVTLPAGAREIEFTVPEMQAETRVALAGPGSGFPVLTQLEYLAPGDNGGALAWRGSWLWSQNAPGPINRSIWFERKFTLDEVPEYGAISWVGDDVCYTYVNGKFVGASRRWSTPGRFDITKFLKKGENRISCRVKNIDSWGGFLADVYIRLKDRDLFFDTDDSWRCESKSNTDRTIPECPEPVVVLGKYTAPPWRGGMAFRYAGPRGMLTPVALEPGKMTVKVDSLPALPVRRLRFVTVDESGKKLDFMLPVTPDASAWRAGETVTVSYPLPYVDRGKCKLFLEDDCVGVAGDPALAEIAAPAGPAPALRRASFTRGGRPMLKMDDELITPVFWHAPSATYGGKDRIAPLANFVDNNIRSYRLTAYFQEFWKEDGTFDFSAFDKEVARLLTMVPNAVFAVQLYCFMPEWWLARNPDDLSRHENGNPRDLWLDKQAHGSKKWLTDGEVPLRAFIDHIKKSRYADRVWGISFTDSNCGEWFWTSADATRKRSYSGYSPADYAAFRAYLKKKYGSDAALAKAWNMPGVTIADAPMPLHKEAVKGSVGALLDASKDMRMIDYFTFRSLALAEAIIHFGKVVKEETDGKWLTGAYYGYFAEMIANRRRDIQSNGHNGFIETALSPYVDFVHAPLRYTVRKTGQPGTMMQVWDTYLEHGKMVYVEQDVRTSLSPREEFAEGKMYCGTPDAPLYDIGQFYRSFGMNAATGTVNYWYDLMGAQFTEKVLNEVITHINDVYRSLGPVKGTTPCEVAVVSDRDSAYYMQYPGAGHPGTMAWESLLRHINELAVPYKSLTVTDLLDRNITVKPMKFYIMLPTLMLTEAQRKGLMERFEREGATVLWIYCAGPFYPANGPSAKNCGDFLGLETRMVVDKQRPEMTTDAAYGALRCENIGSTAPWFFPTGGFDQVIGRTPDGKAAMVVKKIGKATHYYTALTNLPMALYAELLDRSGVFRYAGAPNRDFYWIGNDVLFLHASTNGEKQLKLPDGVEARAIVGPFKGVVRSGGSFPARAGMTYGFHLVKP